MFIELGAAGFAGNRLYFGNFEKHFFDHATYFVRLFERDTRQRTYIDGKRTFIERWEKTAAQCRVEGDSPDEKRDSPTYDYTTVSQRALQSPPVNLFEESGYWSFFCVFTQGFVGGKHITAHDRCECYGNDHRSEKRNDERNAQRL